jgi:nucleotide-binding universal stress UspA family protein
MTTTAPATSPFTRILVPYDGSEPADAALDYAIALGRAGAKLDLLNVVDQVAAIAPEAAAATAFDPTPVLEALDDQGNALLKAAADRCRAAGVEPTVALEHGVPISGIIAAAERNGNDLIVLGTHGRSGFQRLLVGSVTEGVLRAGTGAVLAVNPPVRPPVHAPFRKLLVAVDDSDPADAAAALAGRMARTSGAACIFCHAIDLSDIHPRAANHERVEAFVATLRAQGREIIARARRAAGMTEANSYAAIVEDKPVKGILHEAEVTGADAIVIGSHGRRGLQRLFLGSVAEELLRASELPVFVTRTPSPVPEPSKALAADAPLIAGV